MRKADSTIHLSQIDRQHVGAHARDGSLVPAAQIKLLIPSFESFRLQDFVSWYMRSMFRKVSRGEILLQGTQQSWQVLSVTRHRETSAVAASNGENGGSGSGSG